MGLPRYCSASGMFADAHVNCFFFQQCVSGARIPGAQSAGQRQQYPEYDIEQGGLDICGALLRHLS